MSSFLEFFSAAADFARCRILKAAIVAAGFMVMLMLTPTRRQIAPEGKAPYWPPDLVIDPQKKAPPKRGFFGGHMHGLDHSPRIHNAETRVLVSRLRAVREGRPRVRQRHQGLATSVCGDPGGAIRRSLRARKRGRARAPFASFARRSAIPRTQQAPTMRHSRRSSARFCSPKKKPRRNGAN